MFWSGPLEKWNREALEASCKECDGGEVMERLTHGLEVGQEEAEMRKAVIREPGSVGTSREAAMDGVNGLRYRRGKPSVQTRELLTKPLTTRQNVCLKIRADFVFRISHECSSSAEPLQHSLAEYLA